MIEREDLTSAQEINLCLGECRRQAELLPWKQRKRLAAERAGPMGASDSSDMDYSRTAGLAIFAMARGKASLPEWATKRLRRAVEEARAFLVGLEVGKKMGGK